MKHNKNIVANLLAIVATLFCAGTFSHGFAQNTINISLCPGESYWYNGQAYSEPGTYTVSGHGDDSTTVTIVITTGTAPNISAGTDRTVCSTDELPIQISATGATAGSTYLWSTGETSSSIQAHNAGTYAVTVTGPNGCTGSNQMSLTVMDDLFIEISQASDFCENGSTTLIVNTNADDITWNTGETTPEIEINAYGRYTAKAHSGTCQVSSTIDVGPCEFYLYFPNAITPSYADGLNDDFQVANPELIDEFEIFIYNRWGKLVFHSNDPHFKWNGSENGKVAANQVFSWRAFAKPFTEDKKYSFNGSIYVF